MEGDRAGLRRRRRGGGGGRRGGGGVVGEVFEEGRK